MIVDSFVTQKMADIGWFGIGKQYKGYGACLIAEDDRSRQFIQIPGNIQSLPGQKCTAKGKAGRTVMIAADDQKGNVKFCSYLRCDFIK